jgi:hypothetical protein
VISVDDFGSSCDDDCARRESSVVFMRTLTDCPPSLVEEPTPELFAGIAPGGNVQP